MQASWSIARPDAFVCDAEDLERLTKLLELRVGEVSWAIECADGIDRSGDTLADLLEFDNAPRRSILRLRLSARDKSGQSSASVRLGGQFTTLEASIDGTSEFVEQLSTALESQLYGLRAWYGRVARVDFVHVAFVLMLLVLAAAFLVFALDLVETSRAPTPRESALLPGVIWGILLIGWTLNKVCGRLFPSVTFAMGQGKRRHETLERVRWGVIVAFGVSLAAGLLLVVWP